MSDLTIECEYLSQINWSLLRTGIPLMLEFRMYSDEEEIKQRKMTLSIPHYPLCWQKTEVDISSQYEDLSSHINNRLKNNWNWSGIWELDDSPMKATLQLRVEQAVIECPIELLPPTYWHRVRNAGSRLGGMVETKKGTIHISPSGFTADFRDSHRLWESDNLPYPPLEAALAALIDYRDPYVRPDGPEGSLGRAVVETLLKYLGKSLKDKPENIDALLALKAFYTEVLQNQDLRYRDFIRSYTTNKQAIRLLKSDRERGVLCVDLVCLGCEILEALELGLRPVFILTGDGEHALLGVSTTSRLFADGQPVCADVKKIEELVSNEALRVLDVTLAMKSKDYEDALKESEWSKLGKGFLHAVDIVAARRWSREDGKGNKSVIRIEPLDRPRLASDWVQLHIQQILETEHAEKPSELHLHDPSGLYIPLRCKALGTDALYPVLNAGDSKGLLYEKVIERTGAVALLADGGSGKTYVCERLMLEMAHIFVEQFQAREKNAVFPVVPILYQLRNLGRVKPADFLGILAKEVPCSGPADLVAATKKYHLLFILDGLDESDFSRRYVSPEDYQELFQQIYQLANTSVVLTARPALFPADPASYLRDFTIASLSDWTQQDVEDYLSACESQKRITFAVDAPQGDQASGRKDFLDIIFASEKLQDLARTPLFVRMMVETRDQIREVQDELDLYRRYTRTCLKRREDQIPSEETHEIHREIACSMYLQHKNALHRKDIAKDLDYYLRKRGIEAYGQFLARDVIIHGLLVPEPELRFRFSHISIEHYFLAEWLAPELTALARMQLAPRILAIAPLEAVRKVRQPASACI